VLQHLRSFQVRPWRRTKYWKPVMQFCTKREEVMPSGKYFRESISSCDREVSHLHGDGWWGLCTPPAAILEFVWKLYYKSIPLSILVPEFL
jgi:hypothetical protein